MARKNRGHRARAQNRSQPNPNQDAASPASQAHGSRPKTTPPGVGSPTPGSLAPSTQEPQQPNSPQNQQQDSLPPGTELTEPNTDPDDGFQLVTRRYRAVRSRIERREIHMFSNVQPLAMATDRSSYRRLDSYLDYLFAMLDEAISDERLDFEAIMAEIDRMLGTGRAVLVTAEEEDIDDGGSGTGWDGTGWEETGWGVEIEPTQGGSTPLAISLDSEEHFPELGASRPPRRESQSHQSPWSVIRRGQPAPAPPPAPHISPLAAAPGHATHHNYPTARPLPPPSPPPPVVSPRRPPQASPSSLDLRKLAEDASVLIELYSKSSPDCINDETHQLITSAFTYISTINRHHRVLASSQHGGRAIAPKKRCENEDTTIDAGCIICYSEVADTVLLPCHHLVLCALCCDLMGIKGKEDVWGKKVPCPMCRTHAVDRIKIFR